MSIEHEIEIKLNESTTTCHLILRILRAGRFVNDCSTSFPWWGFGLTLTATGSYVDGKGAAVDDRPAENASCRRCLCLVLVSIFRCLWKKWPTRCWCGKGWSGCELTCCMFGFFSISSEYVWHFFVVQAMVLRSCWRSVRYCGRRAVGLGSVEYPRAVGWWWQFFSYYGLFSCQWCQLDWS